MSCVNINMTIPSGDKRESLLLEQFDQIVVFNDLYSSTRRLRRHSERATATDIIFFSQELSPTVQTKVVMDFISHKNYILNDISLLYPISKSPTGIFLTYRKANWDGFIIQAQEILAFFPANHKSQHMAVRKFYIWDHPRYQQKTYSGRFCQ